MSKVKRIISMSLSEQLVEKIDSGRGLVPRSAVVEEILKGHFGGNQK